jgi:hypothetical protein
MAINFEKINELFSILEEKNIIPSVQLQQIKESGIIFPPLNPPPREWWEKSFECYFALDLLPCHEYGPFYRIGDSKGKPKFWPRMGIPSEEFSESKCFYGLKKPEDTDKVEELYAPKEIKFNDYALSSEKVIAAELTQA